MDTHSANASVSRPRRRKNKTKSKSKQVQNTTSDSQAYDSSSSSDDSLSGMINFVGGDMPNELDTMQKHRQHAPAKSSQERMLGINSRSMRKQQRQRNAILAKSNRDKNSLQNISDMMHLTLGGYAAAVDAKKIAQSQTPGSTIGAISQTTSLTEKSGQSDVNTSTLPSDQAKGNHKDRVPQNIAIEYFKRTLKAARNMASLSKHSKALELYEIAQRYCGIIDNDSYMVLICKEKGELYFQIEQYRKAAATWNMQSAALCRIIVAKASDSACTQQVADKIIQDCAQMLIQVFKNLRESYRRLGSGDAVQSYSRSLDRLKAMVNSDDVIDFARSFLGVTHDELDKPAPRVLKDSSTSGANATDKNTGVQRTKDTENREQLVSTEIQPEADSDFVRDIVDQAMDNQWSEATRLIDRATLFHDVQAQQVINAPHPSTGFTLLMCAAAQGNVKILRHLLKAHVSMEHRDSFGNTAMDLANKFGRADCVQVLSEWTQKPNRRRGISSQQKAPTQLNLHRKLQKWEPDHHNIEAAAELLTLEEEDQIVRGLNAVSAKTSNGTKGLWDADAEHGPADDAYLRSTGQSHQGKWDQFASNKELFGVEVSFEEDMYTTSLNLSKIPESEKTLAAKLAEEIALDSHDRNYSETS